MDHRHAPAFSPLLPAEQSRLADALRRNAGDGAALLTDRRDTTFAGVTDQVTDDEVIFAIKSVPCHYSPSPDDYEQETECKEYVVSRTGQAPLKFRGRFLADSDGERIRERKMTRWHDIRIFAGRNEKYIVQIGYRSRYQGEADHNVVEVRADLAGIAAVLVEYDPRAVVAGYPPNDAYAERQARLLADIESRYRGQVSEVLAEVGYAEEVDADQDAKGE